jgi:lysophospholipase L1-like esterase
MKLVVAIAVVVVLAGCGSGATDTSPTPEADAKEAPLVVGIGDSLMSTTDEEGNGFIDLFAQAQGARGAFYQHVVTSADLATALDDPRLTSRVEEADFIVITAGGNDGDPFGTFPRGTCAPGGDPAACLAAYAPDLEDNLRTVLDGLEASSNATVIVTSPDLNVFVGRKDSPSATFGVDFMAQLATAENAASCAVAEEHDALCADFLHAINGPDATGDATGYLNEDHGHPNGEGIQLMADAVSRAVG